MIIPEPVIEAAYAKHGEIYGEIKDWTIPYHIGLWLKARDINNFSAFEYIYNELRGKWQAFRGAKLPWSAKTSFSNLKKLDAKLQNIKLSNIEKKHMPLIWDGLSKMSDIKRNKDGPSLVAISKVLHFWNPRLFVIVDRQIMLNYVFAHSWLLQQIEEVVEDVENDLPKSARCSSDYLDCDIGDYPGILWWAGQIIRDNPCIRTQFYKHLVKHCPEAKNYPYLQDNEAASVEWLLLGLVELVPGGVKL